MEFINDLRSLTTVLGMLCFLGICAWAYSRRAKSGFDEAALLPFSDDESLVPQAGQHAKEGLKNG